MKGPGIRYDIDIRRVWECPACGNRRKLPGKITSQRCSCEAGVWMRLVGEKRQREFPIRDRIEIPEEEPVESEPETLEETVAEEGLSTESANESSRVEPETAQPPRDNHKHEPPKKSANPQAPSSAEEPDHAPKDTDGPQPHSSSSSENDEAFGENIFDD